MGTCTTPLKTHNSTPYHHTLLLFLAPSRQRHTLKLMVLGIQFFSVTGFFCFFFNFYYCLYCLFSLPILEEVLQKKLYHILSIISCFSLKRKGRLVCCCLSPWVQHKNKGKNGRTYVRPWWKESPLLVFLVFSLNLVKWYDFTKKNRKKQ